MKDHTILLPLLTHMLTAVVLIFCWQRVKIQKYISVIGNALVVLFSIRLFARGWSHGIYTSDAGGWEAPFGIVFVADVFSNTMVLLTALAGLAVAVYSTEGLSRERLRFGFFPISHFLLMGLTGAFQTGDIFNLYVWFEIIIISSFVLMTLGGRKLQIGGGIKYVTINLLASVIFLTAIAILYGLTGSLNMADLAGKVAQVENRGLVNVTAMLFFAGFGIKAAVFPLYFWLPSSYHTPPSAIAALFGGLLTKVGIYALLRVFTLIFIPDAFTGNVLLVVAVGTLLTGALGSLVKRDLRQLFSYLIVCHIGYMVMGLGLFTQAALAGAVFYLVHDIIVKTNLFLITGVISKIGGSVAYQRIGGLYASYPKLSLVFAIVFFSLVGIPPLSGFWPKIPLFTGGFETGSYVSLAAMTIASFITLYVVARMWSAVFWKEAPPAMKETKDCLATMPPAARLALLAPILFLAALSVYIGLGAEQVARVAAHIANEMMDPSPYIRAVLGNEGLNR
jgi:multicomponent Na+:H+ antiporter subunit D